MQIIYNFIPNNFLDRFYIMGLIIFIVGLIFFIKYILRTITISIQRIMHPLPWYSEKLSRKCILTVVFLLTSFIGLIWMYSGVKLQQYQLVGEVSIAGSIEIKKISHNEFMGTFIPSYDNFPYQKISKVMRGDQWALGGAYIIFPSWLRYIGLKSGHQPLDFISKNINQIARPSNDYLFQISEKPDPMWNFLYKIKELANIEMVDFKLTAFTEAKQAKYEIHATSNGYIITRIGEKEK